MAQWKKVIVSGSSAVLSGLTLDTQLAVGQGGTGATTLTDGGVLLGSGTGAVTSTAVLADGQMLVGDGSTDPSLESGATLRTSIGVGTANNVEFANTTVNNLINDSTVAASRITGSFTGSFVGDGSNLTGVAQDIELLGTYGAATLHQTEDKFLVSDNGTEKSITFSNLEDSIFANVSSDIEIAAGGVATIGNDKIDSQHYVAASIDNEHLANNAVDSDELAAGSVDDGHLSDGVATGLAGAGMTATSGVMNVIGTGGAVSVSANAVTLVAANTTLTSIINASLTKIGTSTSQEYITFGTSNEVNTFVNNTERHSVTATGVDVTGNLTISGDLDVNGTTTTIDTANLTIADKFAIFASGSTSATDGGIIVQGGVTSGYALGYDAGVGRWAFDADLAHDATDLGPDAYVGVVQFGTATPDTQTPTPTYGGVTNGIGTIYVDTDDSEIWIYA